MCEQASWERKCCSLLCSKLWELWDAANPVPTAAVFAAPGKVSARDISIMGGREREMQRQCTDASIIIQLHQLHPSELPCFLKLAWVGFLCSTLKYS